MNDDTKDGIITGVILTLVTIGLFATVLIFINTAVNAFDKHIDERIDKKHNSSHSSSEYVKYSWIEGCHYSNANPDNFSICLKNHDDTRGIVELKWFHNSTLYSVNNIAIDLENNEYHNSKTIKYLTNSLSLVNMCSMPKVLCSVELHNGGEFGPIVSEYSAWFT